MGLFDNTAWSALADMPALLERLKAERVPSVTERLDELQLAVAELGQVVADAAGGDGDG
ncbi:MAG: hypothetical protein LBT21_06355 [Oscillospiraceae bacterium]|jgi:hypothetical protein|nr:hypothetical protein [Oscillospiraceae bacterium]